MTREEAREALSVLKIYDAQWLCEAVDMAIEALQTEAEPIVIRSKTLMPTKDFEEWAKRVREVNPNAIVIPCDAEVVSAEAEWIGYNADKEDWLRTDGTPIFLVCDKCHGTVINNGSAHWNFCPNCGARMKGGAE